MTARVDSRPRGSAGRTSRRGARVVIAAFAAVALGGCANPFSPEGTDPHVYKGASDPLFEQPADARDAALRERFELIQSR